MRLRHLLWTLIAALLLPAFAIAGDERIDWSLMPDFDALRQEVGQREDFVDSCDINDAQVSEDQIYTYLNDSDWEAAANGADTRLQTCPVDIQMHLYAGIALQRMQEFEAGQYHFDWYWGLVNSVLASGDGETPETAYVTISVSEEYAVLSALRLRLRWQSSEGNRDVFLTVDEDGGERTIYFFPDLHWRRMLEKMPE